MKKVLISIGENITEKSRDHIICVNGSWKHYAWPDNLYFDSYASLIEYTSANVNSQVPIYVDDLLIAEAHRIGRFNVVRRMLRDARIKYVKTTGNNSLQRARYIFGAECEAMSSAVAGGKLSTLISGKKTALVSVGERVGKIDILIVNLNNKEYTLNCVRDLLLQDCHEFTAVIYDQASEEHGTDDALAELAKINERISVVRLDKRMPLNHLWNKFAKEAKSKYLCFLNNDVKLPHNFISHTLLTLDLDADIAIACHATNNTEYSTVTDMLSYKILDSIYDGEMPNSITGDPGRGAYVIQGWDFAIRRSAYSPIPESIHTYSGDAWLYYRAYEMGYRCAMILSAPIIHYLSKSMAHRSNPPAPDFQALTREIGEHEFTVNLEYSKLQPTYSEFEYERTYSMREIFKDETSVLILTNQAMGGGSQFFLDILHAASPKVKKYILTPVSYSGHRGGIYQNSNVPLKLVDQDGNILMPVTSMGSLNFILDTYKVSAIVVNHFLGFDVYDAIDKIKRCGTPYKFIIHDFICLCKNVHLLLNNKPCELNCNASCEFARDLPRWREMFYEFMTGGDVLANSEFTRKKVLSQFPTLSMRTIRYDISDKIRKNTYSSAHVHSGPLVIAVPGAIGRHKGSDIIYEISEMLASNNINAKLVVIGYTDRHANAATVNKCLLITGRYDREALAHKYADVNASVTLIASVVKETFCYTMSEAMQIGTPVIAYNIGAPHYKMKNNQFGWSIDISDPVNNLYDIIRSLANNRDEIIEKMKNLRSAIRVDNNFPTVIIPVRDAAEEFKKCIGSVDVGTDVRCNVIVIDDQSEDESFARYLDAYAPDNPLINYVVIRNYVNQGFIKSVNTALDVASESDCVILNSDTVVPKNWLGRILKFAADNKDAASITPYSNNATICSFPNIMKSNELPAGFTVDMIDDVFEQMLDGSQRIPIPTGHGFCMYMSREVIRKIGRFDEIYGIGYGEENDWCMKARAAGYQNFHLQNLFVFHAGAATFGMGIKNERCEKNSKILSDMHPKYMDFINSYISADPCAKNRMKIFELIKKRMR